MVGRGGEVSKLEGRSGCLDLVSGAAGCQELIPVAFHYGNRGARLNCSKGS